MSCLKKVDLIFFIKFGLFLSTLECHEGARTNRQKKTLDKKKAYQES